LITSYRNSWLPFLENFLMVKMIKCQENSIETGNRILWYRKCWFARRRLASAVSCSIIFFWQRNFKKSRLSFILMPLNFRNNVTVEGCALKWTRSTHVSSFPSQQSNNSKAKRKFSFQRTSEFWLRCSSFSLQPGHQVYTRPQAPARDKIKTPDEYCPSNVSIYIRYGSQELCINQLYGQ
jgi:hypothetical protein